MRTPAKLVFAAFFAIMGLFATVQTSSAMTIAPASQERAASTLLQDIRYGCGAGWTPNRYGRCVRIGRYYAPRYYAPRYYYAPRHYAPRYGYYPRYHYYPRYRYYRW